MQVVSTAEFGLVLNINKKYHGRGITLTGNVWSNVYNTEQGTSKSVTSIQAALHSAWAPDFLSIIMSQLAR